MNQIPIYLHPFIQDAQTLYRLSFRQHPALYYWLKKFQFVQTTKTTGQLSIPADDGYLELIEIAAKGKILFNRSGLQKEAIKKGISKPRAQLNRFEIPKLTPPVRVQ